MKFIYVLIISAIVGGLLTTAPAVAADMPEGRPAYGYPAPASRTRIIAVPGCHLGLERFWDGYAWRSRSIQICN